MIEKNKSPANKSKKIIINRSDANISKEITFAEISLLSANLNAQTSRMFAQGVMANEIDLLETVAVMHDKINQVRDGDLSDLEATLTAQTTSLDTIFNELAKLSAINIGKHLHAAETYMRLALKAQAQCTRTVEALARMKNPPIVFANQANIAQGCQQINNLSLNTNAPFHAEKTVIQRNELLEVNDGGTTMDIGTTQTTSGENKAMATLD